MSLISAIHAAVAAVAPIDGVSIGDPADKRTWRIDFKDTATMDDRVAGMAALQAFDIAKQAANEPVLAEIAKVEQDQTPRRLREAVLGTGGTWLSNLDRQIAALRLLLRP